MRRRLFWTIAGVAAVTGFLVLAASAVASQRAVIGATYREMSQSAAEVVDIITEAVDGAGQRPGAAAELFRLFEGGQVGPIVGRIRRTAGSSEIAIAARVGSEPFRSTAEIFDRIELDEQTLASGQTQLARTERDELVVIAPTEVETRAGDLAVLVALARDAPVVRTAEQFRGLIPIALGIAVVAAVLARLLANQLSARLEPLADASRRLASGDLSARVPPLGDDELDVLAEAFNDMAADLESGRERERDFILGVGHDLRTPLTTIAGYAEALESGGIDGGDLQRIGHVLGAQSRQMSRLIEDLSTLARLDQPEFGLRFELVDVGAHVTEIVEGFRLHAEEEGVRLSVESDPGISIETDPDRLAQIARNLVENALAFTPETGSVQVSVSGDQASVRISVADSGVGIAGEDLGRVFDRHFVGRRRRVRKEGSGLGLSIVEGLVARLGGQVTVESRPGQGTVIEVQLPRR